MIPLSELNALNADRTANRERILALWMTNVEIPRDHPALIAFARLATAAAGYTSPSPSPDRRARFLSLAVAAAERATTVEPAAASGYYWYAVSRALELNLLGLPATLMGIWKVKRAAQQAVELDPRENAGGPLRIRAMLAFRLPFFLGGDKRAALRDLEHAVAMYPEFRENLLFLAEVQAEVVDVPTGLATAERGLALPASSEREQEARWTRAFEALIQRLRG